MRILIVGAGIAGPTLAYWLLRAGHEPVIMEHAPRLRDGGYLVDFWGSGFDVADRMGIVPQLMERGYVMREVREVSDRGRRIAHFDPRPVIGAAGGRYVSIARADLARAIVEALDDRVEMIFGDTVHSLHDDGTRVRVEFAHAAPREFDLVIGADGLHSRVRALAFGPEDQFARELGIAVAAFDLDGYRPRDELIAVTRTQVGGQALRVALRDDATMFCFMFRHCGDVPIDDEAGQRELLRERLGGMGWEVQAILARLPEARTLYLDKASQIRMPSWSSGRIALVGDAAACPSLLAGQGSALAMVQAYVLAGELSWAGGDHRAAFSACHGRLASVVATKQDAAVSLGAAFAPRNRMQLLLRNTVVSLMAIPFVASMAMGRSLRDPIDLPEPPAQRAPAG